MTRNFPTQRPTERPTERPLDAALRDRLHLKGKNPFALSLIRGAMHACDGVGRVFGGQPFFALRESEHILTALRGATGADLLWGLLAQNGGTRIAPHGLDHIPDSGPVIIAATHPTGMFDFVAHASVLLKRRPDLKVVANQETEAFLGADLIIPVRIDKKNRATSGRDTQRAMLRHLDSGGALLIFGSGRVPDRRDGQLVEPPWRGGTTKISKSRQALIIPAALDAQNLDGYYRTRALARFISGGNDHFGAMIGSLRYGAELQAKLGGQFDVYYGAPLAPGTAPNKIKSMAESLVPGLYTDTV